MTNDCIFCKIVRGEAKSWKVYEDEHSFAFLDIHPVSEYHTLIIPKQHFENIFDVPEEDLLYVMRGLKQVVGLYHQRLGLRNVQIVNSSGSEAQQDVFHLHFHIVPRQRGDGQNVRWKTFPEWTGRFDQMLERLR